MANVRLALTSPVASGGVAHYLDTSTTYSAGNLLELQNNTVAQFAVDYGGNVIQLGNLSLGGTAVRSSTTGTKAINIFNGTAPAGTLTNGVSFYSTSGEAYVMDAAGNATLLSPHDAHTNEWVFRSTHTPTGRQLTIRMEELVRRLVDHFGWDELVAVANG